MGGQIPGCANCARQEKKEEIEVDDKESAKRQKVKSKNRELEQSVKTVNDCFLNPSSEEKHITIKSKSDLRSEDNDYIVKIPIPQKKECRPPNDSSPYININENHSPSEDFRSDNKRSSPIHVDSDIKLKSSNFVKSNQEVSPIPNLKEKEQFFTTKFDLNSLRAESLNDKSTFNASRVLRDQSKHTLSSVKESEKSELGIKKVNHISITMQG